MYLHHNLSTKVKYKVLVSQQTLMLQLESKPLKTGGRHQYPKSEHSCLCWGSCTIFKCSTLEFSGRLQNPSLAFPVQRYPCAGIPWALQAPWQSRSYGSVGGRQSLHSCFLQLGFSTSLSGKCYWLIKANCWQTPDSLWGQGEEPGWGEGCGACTEAPTRQVDALLIISTIDL